MELKYEIHTIKNSQGTGEDRQYVKVTQHKPITDKDIEAAIQNRCSLTKGDVAAVLSELHDICVREISMGRRFHLPGIGYFSLSASLKTPEENPDKKITGKEVRVTGINFRPEARLMDEIQHDIHFVRSSHSSRSMEYTEEHLLARIRKYLQTNHYITVSIMRSQFGLSQYAAQKWLTLFCGKGVMVKEGTPHSPIYFLK